MKSVDSVTGSGVFRTLLYVGLAVSLPLAGIPSLAQSATVADGAAKTGASLATLGSLQDAFVAIADQLEPAVVTVTAHKTVRSKTGTQGQDGEEGLFPDLGKHPRQRAFRSQGTGAGVILTTDGWLVTNDHVIGGADTVTIKLHDGREFDGKVRRDYRSDLALVKIEGGPFIAAKLGSSDSVKVGQWAVAIGSPFKYEGSLSVGVISGLGRRQEIRDENGEGDGRVYPDMIQTDAAINPGNSGGPLVNLAGEVIGVNTAIESDNGNSVGIGFAIPIDDAKFVIDQLRTKGAVSYGYLGIEPETVTPRVGALYKVECGALVKAEPPAGSPANRAGIHVEDVITRIGDTAIRGEADLRSAVGRMPAGAVVQVTLVRSGKEHTLPATIAEAPAPRFGHSDSGPQAPSLGVDVAVLTSEIANRVGLAAKSGAGVVVKSVDSGSSVAESEMKTGDVILQVNGVPTPTVEAFRKATAALRPGDTVRILWQGKRYPDTMKRVTIVTLD